MRTIAVYSELDRDALHVRLADEAWNIGGAPGCRVLPERPAASCEAAWESDADGDPSRIRIPGRKRRLRPAGHGGGPDRGWGPPPEAIEHDGGQNRSPGGRPRRAGAAVVPGSSFEPVTEASKQAAELASRLRVSGGGESLGTGAAAKECGWRTTEEDLAEALEGAQREAGGLFRQQRRCIWKNTWSNARHIEAQIIVDGHGHYRSSWGNGTVPCSAATRS